MNEKCVEQENENRTCNGDCEHCNESHSCNGDCEHCSSECGSNPQSFAINLNEFSKIKKIIGVVSGKGGGVCRAAVLKLPSEVRRGR